MYSKICNLDQMIVVIITLKIIMIPSIDPLEYLNVRIRNKTAVYFIVRNVQKMNPAVTYIRNP